MLKNGFVFLAASLFGFFLFVSAYFLLHVAQSAYPLIPQTQFSISRAPTDSLIGNLATFSGQVLWESRIAATPSALTKAQTVQQGELYEVKDTGSFTLVFPDVLVATASAKGTISVIQTLPANVVLQQQNGTVSYAVLGSKVPVSVRGLDLLVNLHTSTSKITVDSKKSQVRIIVMSGTMTLAYTDTDNTSVVKNLTAGQEVLFDNNTKTYTLY